MLPVLPVKGLKCHVPHRPCECISSELSALEFSQTLQLPAQLRLPALLCCDTQHLSNMPSASRCRSPPSFITSSFPITSSVTCQLCSRFAQCMSLTSRQDARIGGAGDDVKALHHDCCEAHCKPAVAPLLSERANNSTHTDLMVAVSWL